MNKFILGNKKQTVFQYLLNNRVQCCREQLVNSFGKQHGPCVNRFCNSIEMIGTIGCSRLSRKSNCESAGFFYFSFYVLNASLYKNLKEIPHKGRVLRDF